jgi:NAD(P)-dependent dehydrogenase (short-subunit alcohol dehydrogenase family)
MSDTSPTRVAIVTGAAQGIGRAIALRLAADGLAVAVNDVAAKKAQLDEVVELIEQKNVRGLAVPADVTKEDEVKGMVEEVVAQLGKVNVVSFLRHHFIVRASSSCLGIP